MNLESKIEYNTKIIDNLLNQPVKVNFLYIVNDKVLVDCNNQLPSVELLKKDLNDNNLIKSASDLLGKDVLDIRQVLINDENYGVRYYIINLNDIYMGSDYKYVNFDIENYIQKNN